MAEVEAQTEAGAGEEAQALNSDDFANLLEQEFRPQSDKAKEAVEVAVQTLAEQVLADSTVVSSNVVHTIEAYIAAIDNKLTDQLN